MNFEQRLNGWLESSQQPMQPDPTFWQEIAWDVNNGLVPYGYIAEFGVASGKTINEIADAFPERTVYGFDWFEGLPEDWNSTHPKGSFAQNVPEVRNNVQLVHGLFEDTFSLWNYERETDNIPAFIHLDADLYSSTKTVLDTVKYHVQPGTILLFDELYYNYDGDNYKSHEYKAVIEFVEFLEKERDLTLIFWGQRHSESFAFMVE